MNTQNLLIAISRQSSSGGSLIAQSIAKRLGYRYLDREILWKAAGSLGQKVGVLERREEKISEDLEGLRTVLGSGAPELASAPPPMHMLYDRDIFQAETYVIRKIADEQSAVILGRCGFYLLKGRPGLVSIFIHASEEFRVERAMKAHEITADNAFAALRESDRLKSAYIQAMTGANWTDSLNYHLTLDTGATGFDRAEDMILSVIESVKDKLR
jgi:CMP/dCMP kinase